MIWYHNSQGENQDGCEEGSEHTMDTMKREMQHTLVRTQCGEVRCHEFSSHYQNSVQLLKYFWNFQFLKSSWLRVTKTAGSKTTVKGAILLIRSPATPSRINENQVFSYSYEGTSKHPHVQ
jgi:hypothetical protein